MNTINCSCGKPDSCGCCCKSCKFNPCAVTCAPCQNTFGGVYAYIYNTAAQTVAADAAVTFSSNGPLSGTVTHTAGTAEIVVGETGVYLVDFSVSGEGAAQITAYRNGAAVEGTTYSAADGEVNGRFIIAAQIGDVLTFVNTGEAGIVIAAQGTTPEAVVNASVTIVKIF